MRRPSFQMGCALLGTLASMLILGCGNDVANDQTPVAASEQRIKLSRQEVLSMGFADDQGGEIVGGELWFANGSTGTPGLPLGVSSLSKDGSTSLCRGYYLQSVSYAGSGWYFSNRPIGSAEGWGPRTLNVTVSKSVTSEFNATVGISAGAVSAGVGYTIGATYGVSASSDINVPSGRYYKLEGYARYDKHTWQVWYDGCPVPGPNKYVGNGESYRPDGGVIFVTKIIR